MKLTIEGTLADVRQFLKTGDGKKVKVTEEKPELTRKQIIEYAKADIKKIANIAAYGTPVVGNVIYQHRTTRPRFTVNRKKRTIIVLVYGNNTSELYAKGKAKCVPGDAFNAWIGKAIAIRRAYGLPVPKVYLHAPKPEGVRVGDIVQSESSMYDKFPYKVSSIKNDNAFEEENSYIPIRYLRVVDDTDREY